MADMLAIVASLLLLVCPAYRGVTVLLMAALAVLAFKRLLEGRVRPVIGARFSLDQIPEAHAVLEPGEVDGRPFHGKVVASVD